MATTMQRSFYSLLLSACMLWHIIGHCTIPARIMAFDINSTRMSLPHATSPLAMLARLVTNVQAPASEIMMC